MPTETPTDIEDLLRADAARWQAGADHADDSSNDAIVPTATTRGRRALTAWPVVTVAAAVIVVLAIPLGLHLARGGTGRADTTPAAAAHGRAMPPAKPARLLTLAQTAGGVSLAWRLVALDNHASTITVWYDAGDGWCDKPKGFYVHETATSVLVENVNYWAHSPDGGCPDTGVLGRAIITLRQPLGSRTLIHATIDKKYGTADPFR